MNNLKERRLELGMTQPQLAHILREADSRIDTGMVSRFETGACLPSPKVLRAIESALQAHRTQLFGDEEISALDSLGATEALPEPSDEVDYITALIPMGRENAVTRQSLCTYSGMPDRKVRELIEQARREGFIIVTESDGRGYYRTEDVREIEKAYWSDRRRALSILARLKTMRRVLRENGRAV